MTETTTSPVEQDRRVRREIIHRLTDLVHDLEIQGLEHLPATRELREAITRLYAQPA